MSRTLNASYEARIKNAKDLVTIITGYGKYLPTAEELTVENFRNFLNETDLAITRLKESHGQLITAKKDARNLFTSMVRRSRNVRSLIGEIKGTSSAEYSQVNSVVRIITGENISKYAKERAKNKKLLKEGEQQPEGISVSRLDNKTRLGNFRQLIGIIKSFTGYEPADEQYSVASLELLRDELAAILENTASKESSYINAKSELMKRMNDPNGVSDRAKKAKLIVRRAYGYRSPELKALTGKKY